MKLDNLLHKTRIAVLRLHMCTSISLSKITHQIWRNHPFIQRNRTTEGAVGVGVGGKMQGEVVVGQNLKNEWGPGNIGWYL